MPSITAKMIRRMVSFGMGQPSRKRKISPEEECNTYPKVRVWSSLHGNVGYDWTSIAAPSQIALISVAAEILLTYRIAA